MTVWWGETGFLRVIFLHHVERDDPVAVAKPARASSELAEPPLETVKPLA
jgi:hypothetical protein